MSFMNEMFPALGILSSMITPAVLILASGSLIMTTSQRLSRVIERVRKISQEFLLIEKSNDKESANESKRAILYSLLKKSAKRSKLLTKSLACLYISLGLFVATSLAIGVAAVSHSRFTWVPTVIGMIGAVCLFISSVILIIEARLTYSVIADEVEFVMESSSAHAPEILKKKLRRNWRKWIGV
jgi:hypothetical protein